MNYRLLCCCGWLISYVNKVALLRERPLILKLGELSFNHLRCLLVSDVLIIIGRFLYTIFLLLLLVLFTGIVVNILL